MISTDYPNKKAVILYDFHLKEAFCVNSIFKKFKG